jgi:hypothetical protein
MGVTFPLVVLIVTNARWNVPDSDVTPNSVLVPGWNDRPLQLGGTPIYVGCPVFGSSSISRVGVWLLSRPKRVPSDGLISKEFTRTTDADTLVRNVDFCVSVS